MAQLARTLFTNYETFDLLRLQFRATIINTVICIYVPLNKLLIIIIIALM